MAFWTTVRLDSPVCTHVSITIMQSREGPSANILQRGKRGANEGQGQGQGERERESE